VLLAINIIYTISFSIASLRNDIISVFQAFVSIRKCSQLLATNEEKVFCIPYQRTKKNEERSKHFKNKIKETRIDMSICFEAPLA
jgi:hypothetical protein